MTATMNAPVLVLNGFTEQPLNRTTMARAMKMLAKGKARLKHAYEFDICGGSREQAAPAVIEMLYFVAVRPHHGKLGVTKKNVQLRDNNICQYCSKKIKKHATVDHVHPKSRGGKDTWLNLVTACQTCNQRKANRTPREANMRLIAEPYEPDRISWESVVNNTEGIAEWTKYVTTYHKTIIYDKEKS